MRVKKAFKEKKKSLFYIAKKVKKSIFLLKGEKQTGQQIQTQLKTSWLINSRISSHPETSHLIYEILVRKR